MTSDITETYLQKLSDSLIVENHANIDEFLNKNSLETLKSQKQELIAQVLQEEQELINLRSSIESVSKENESIEVPSEDMLNEVKELKEKHDKLLESVAPIKRELDEENMSVETYKNYLQITKILEEKYG